MGNVLKITRPDKSTHILPLSNESFWLAYNKRLPVNLKVKIETITEEEAAKVEYKDKTYISPSEAIQQVDKLKEDNINKDAEIAELKKLLAEAASKGNKAPTQETAIVVIEKIKAATTPEEVNALVENDTRKTVVDAANAKLLELTQAAE